VFASVSSGTATFTLSPASGTLTTGAIDILANTGSGDSANAIGFQLVASFTGSVPNDIKFTASPPSGFAASYNTFSDITDGKKLQLIIDTSSSSNYSTSGQSVKIGTIEFTKPTSGSMAVSFDASQTLILNSNYEDIVAPPANTSYTFTASEPSPTDVEPSATPVPSATPIEEPTVTTTPGTEPTNTPTVEPSPTPEPYEPICSNDLDVNEDGKSDIFDIPLILSNLGHESPADNPLRADINCDHIVDHKDFIFWIRR
jgi:hypothetical protein